MSIDDLLSRFTGLGFYKYTMPLLSLTVPQLLTSVIASYISLR